MKKIVGIIPARYASSRFPGKLLEDLGGKTVLERVFERAVQASYLSALYIATDDKSIASCARSFGAEVLMTSPDITNGTLRCHAAVKQLELSKEVDAVINIQGDEPFVEPCEIDDLARALLMEDVDIATLITPLKEPSLLRDPHTVKLVKDLDDYAMYFSRQPIPYIAGEEMDALELWMHVGLYGFRKEVLYEIVHLPAGKLEMLENLEQLRWLENGYRIKTVRTSHAHIGIDTPEDLQRARNIIQGLQRGGDGAD